MATWLSAKITFGQQLRLYRERAGLTQEEFADFHKTDKSFITKVENGKTAVGIDLMEAYAETFGVEYYEMGNPNFKIPALSKMPAALHQYIAKVKEERNARKQEPGLKITVYLDPIIASNFLAMPKTARMIAEEIEKTSQVVIPPGRITSELTKAPRNKKVKVVPKPVGRAESGYWYQLIE